MLSVISSTHATWQELNFADFQKILESTVVELASNREKGESGRAELVQQTKEFRKSASEEVRRAVLSLLKSFQTEVDASRKRCQFAEEAYINVYKRLMDLPDPTLALAEVQSLQKRANRVGEVEAELRRLKESNDQLKTDASSARSLENENKRLQKLLTEMTDNVGSRLESETSKVREESDRILMEKEHELMLLKAETADKLRAMEEKCTSLTKALELAQSEVFKLKLQQDKSDVGRSSEVELLMDELEKAHLKIKDLEETLDASGVAPSSSTSTSIVEADERIRQLHSRVEELESDLVDKDNENNVLTSTVHKLRTEHEQQTSAAEAEIAGLKHALSTVHSELAEARKTLNSQSDYVEVVRELALLRSIEFPEEYDELPGKSAGDPSVAAEGGSGKKPPLEVLLMNKNRNLQNQIAELNAAKDRMTSELDQLRQYETESRQQTQEQSELIRLLESDLYRLQMALNEPGRTAVAVPSSPAPSQQSQRSPAATTVTPSIYERDNRRESQMLAEAIGEQRDNEGSSEDQTEFAPLQVNNAVTDSLDKSLLQIVQNQRDRFRARAEDLEQAEASVRQHLTAVQRELESVRADNVKLYEKIRFLQSYSSPIGGRADFRSSASTANPSDGQVSVHLGSDPTILKYSQAYEAHMDPFNQFSRQEKQRFYQDLRPYEKVMLRLGRTILGNRRARLMAFAYALVMHILIFLALYNAAHFQRSADEAEASCMLRYAEHMRAAHPDSSHNP